MENGKGVIKGSDTLTAVPFWKELIILLGVSAIVMNVIMCMVYLFFIIMRKKDLPWGLIITSFLFFGIQVYYFFYYKYSR